MSTRAQHLYEFGPYRLDTAEQRLLRDGKPVPLTPKAFETLVALVERSGHLVEKEELMKVVWADAFVEESNLTNNVSALRRLLGKGKSGQSYIETVPKRGYRFTAPVKELPPENLIIEKRTLTRVVTEDQTVEEVAPRPIAISGKRVNRIWLVPVAGAMVAGLVLLGFYISREQEPTPADSIRTVAVLPFKPLVAENRNEELELGMADTLITRLSNSEKIVVRPITSVRRYGDLEQDSLAAGRELGVDSVLDGSIQTWGDRIRISARLVSVNEGKQLWAGQFDEKFTDIFAVQDSICERVVAALVPRLTGEDRQRVTKHDTNNIEAYQLYLKGRFHAARLTLPETKKAISYFQQAIEIDPTYALAYVRLSSSYRNPTLTSDVLSSEAMPKAKAAASKALEIDDSLSEAYIALGQIAFWYDWDWVAAERYYNRALELSPNSDVHAAYSALLSSTGRHEKAIAHARRAREIDPLMLSRNALEAQVLFYAGRGEEAIHRIKQTFELDPEFWLAHLVLTRVYIEKGMYPEAIAAATKARDFSGGLSEATSLIGYTLAISRKREEARALLEGLKRRSVERYVPPYNIALVYNGLDEREETLDWLEKGFEQRDARMTFLKVDRKWDKLRSDSRFISLIKRMKLE